MHESYLIARLRSEMSHSVMCGWGLDKCSRGQNIVYFSYWRSCFRCRYFTQTIFTFFIFFSALVWFVHLLLAFSVYLSLNQTRHKSNLFFASRRYFFCIWNYMFFVYAAASSLMWGINITMYTLNASHLLNLLIKLLI